MPCLKYPKKAQAKGSAYIVWYDGFELRISIMGRNLHQHASVGPGHCFRHMTPVQRLAWASLAQGDGCHSMAS